MQNKPSISVIIPTYNRANDLLSAIRSVLGQTYPVNEILVCDDGSTDDSKALVKALQQDRIKWIDCGRNGMPSIPRNIGISRAGSEWLAFLDSDDAWLPDKIEAQINRVQATGRLAVSAQAWRIRPDHAPCLYLNYTGDTIRFTDLLQVNYVICSSMMVHRSVLLSTGGFPKAGQFKAIEDYALWLKVAAVTDIDFVSTPVVNYQDVPAQSIRANDVSVVEQRKLILSELLGWLRVSGITEQKRYERLTRQELGSLQPSAIRFLKLKLKRILARFIN